MRRSHTAAMSEIAERCWNAKYATATFLRSTRRNRMISTDLTAAYQQPTEEVIAELGSDAARGLATEETQSRLARYGPNELAAETPIPAWRKFLAQFQDVLIVLLLIAAAISLVMWLVERDDPVPYEALVIFAIVLLNGILGYVQEARAERSVAALRAMAAAEASVLRDGQTRRVPATDLVPGDIILIEEGDTIPADGRLVRSVALQMAEASLTGESLPVSKDTDALTDEVGIGDRSNMVFSGTVATYGHGRAVVTATGMQTEMGKIAGLLRQTESEATPLQQELDRTGKLLGIVVVIIAVVMIVTILVVEGIREFSAIVDVLILGVALAVGAADRANNAVLQERDGRWIIQGDPTEGALIVAARKAGLTDAELDQRFARVGEVPFSSERKLMSTVHTDVQRPERLLVFSKGAPDILLSRCREVWVGEGPQPQPLTEERRARIRAANEQLTGEALRTLGI